MDKSAQIKFLSGERETKEEIEPEKKNDSEDFQIFSWAFPSTAGVPAITTTKRQSKYIFSPLNRIVATKNDSIW